MSEQTHLRNAPITEALIDIRVDLPPGTTIEAFASIRDELSEEYPTCRERHKWHARFELSDAAPPTVQTQVDTPDGYLLTSRDGTQVVQARLDGFTFSRLKPYQDWEHLRDTARQLWQPFCRAAAPVSVNRIAVRYINRIEIPQPIKGLKEWILTLPEIAPDVPQAIAGSLMHLRLPFEEPRGFVNIHQKIDQVGDRGAVSMIFDIDAFLPDQFAPDDGEMWERLEDLREIKNRVFFGSITERTRSLFE